MICKKQCFAFGAALLLTIIMMAACQKKEAAAPVLKTPAYTAHKEEEDPGRAHNYILAQYEDQFGLTIGNEAPSVAEVKEIIKNCLSIGIREGDFDPDIYTTVLADTPLTDMIGMGYFDGDGRLKSTEEIVAINLSMITNSDIRDALTLISYYEGDEAYFIAFADSVLEGITGLSTQEQMMINGFKSVLTASHIFWTERQDEGAAVSNIDKIAIADAWGFAIGWNAAVDQGYWYLAEPFAKYKSAQMSISAARNMIK